MHKLMPLHNTPGTKADTVRLLAAISCSKSCSSGSSRAALCKDKCDRTKSAALNANVELLLLELKFATPPMWPCRTGKSEKAFS